MAQDDFEQYIRSVEKRPYRKLIEERVRSAGATQLADAFRAAETRFPDRLQPYLPLYLEAANDKFLCSRLFWQVSTCREALANILELATEAMPDDDEVRQAFRQPFADGGDLAHHLFEVPTASFAQAAAATRRQRHFMGIRKGLWG